MKKNYSMRIASMLLVLVLLTTCVISGTFAKYTTAGTATDEAQVAKWGVNVVAESKDNKEYQATALADEESAVLTGETKLLAPGSGVKFGSITITGTPEVAVKVTYTANLELTNWGVADDAEYMPLVFVINGAAHSMAGYADVNTIADFEAKIEEIIAAYSKEYEANTNLSTKLDDELTVSCYWAFEGDNAKDTALGNKATDDTTLPKVNLTITCTVTQLDE